MPAGNLFLDHLVRAIAKTPCSGPLVGGDQKSDARAAAALTAKLAPTSPTSPGDPTDPNRTLLLSKASGVLYKAAPIAGPMAAPIARAREKPVMSTAIMPSYKGMVELTRKEQCLFLAVPPDDSVRSLRPHARVPTSA